MTGLLEGSTHSVSQSRPQELTLGLRFGNGGLSLRRNLGLAIRALSCIDLASHRALSSPAQEERRLKSPVNSPKESFRAKGLNSEQVCDEGGFRQGLESLVSRRKKINETVLAGAYSL